MIILTLNCRSQSIHFVLYRYPNPTPLRSGHIDGIGRHISQDFLDMSHIILENHFDALDYILKTLYHPSYGVLDPSEPIEAVGHRVVHGGETYAHSVKIDEQVILDIKQAERMAPKYNKPNRMAILAAMELLPRIDHVAIFDTAFHHTIPPKVYIYPLPYEWYEKHRVRRYGFHGSSHLYLSRRAAVHLGKPVDRCNLITIHLDLGISLCAIKNGRSVDISTGMTPVEGTAQEHRCGNIDPSIPGFIMDWEELSSQQIEEVLNEKSGLLSITDNCRNRLDVLKKAQDGDPRAVLAATVESYRLRKFIGEYLCVLGRCDAIVFSSGQGEIEAEVRQRVLSNLECFNIILDENLNNSPDCINSEVKINHDNSQIALYVIPTDEARVFCEDTAAIANKTFTGPSHNNYTFDFSPVDSLI
ncbi:MAG: acetate/propionate family kinase [Desulfuromonas sp.]|nr:acetate/propionate family kinase [Desulfuromonas sp.]